MKRNELKKIIASFFVMATLFVLASVVSADFVELIYNDTGIELRGSSSESKYATHYEVADTWPNGNVKYIRYWQFNIKTGALITEVYTTDPYPQSGQGSLPPYGAPGGFQGCFCPNCVGLYN